ncbi:GPP34 family phosphoprotein [Streptomyces sp. NPDC094437]|uniref:GOLPH3/VPS74 family protein n=2 Tax=unclassified Streptomyces TaxID=2593676 RepID=UPI00381D63CF
MSDGSLSLPARLYLLAWDPRKSEVTDGPLVRAGALVELVQRGLLIDDDGVATPVDLDSETGDAVLDGLLELIRESRPHSWQGWLTPHARVTLDAVREQLTADGYLRADRKRVLGIFPSVAYTLARTTAVDALREEAEQLLTGPIPLPEISPQEAALLTLATTTHLLPTPDPTRTTALTTQATTTYPALTPLLTTLKPQAQGPTNAAWSRPGGPTI